MRMDMTTGVGQASERGSRIVVKPLERKQLQGVCEGLEAEYLRPHEPPIPKIEVESRSHRFTSCRS